MSSGRMSNSTEKQKHGRVRNGSTTNNRTVKQAGEGGRNGKRQGKNERADRGNGKEPELRITKQVKGKGSIRCRVVRTHHARTFPYQLIQ